MIAEGWHDHLGGLHAEQMAIHDAEEKGHNTNGAVAYVTLEPCNHFGRTPPCTEALLWAGIGEVIIDTEILIQWYAEMEYLFSKKLE